MLSFNCCLARDDSPRPAEMNGDDDDDVAASAADEKDPNPNELVLLLLELEVLLPLQLEVKLSNFCEIPPRTFTISLCWVLLGNAYISFKWFNLEDEYFFTFSTLVALYTVDDDYISHRVLTTW